MAREAVVGTSGANMGGRLGFARAGVAWKSRYLAMAALLDAVCALLAGMLAFEIRYHARIEPPPEYLVITGVLPPIWLISVTLALSSWVDW